MRKLIGMLLAVVLIVTSFTACIRSDKKSGEAAGTDNVEKAEQTVAEKKDIPVVNKTGFPIVNEPITLTVLFPKKPEHGDLNEMWFTKAIAEKTGITLRFDYVDESGFDEKKNLALASGDYPDIFFTGTSREDEAVYGTQGIFTDLSPYLEEYAPETMKMLEKYPEVKKTFYFENGALYAIPGFIDVERYIPANNIYINEQWLDNLGYNMPENLDELYDVLKAFKQGDPNGNGQADEVPLSGLYGSNIDIFILSALGYVDNRDDVIDGKYVYVPMQQEYREYLEYMRRLYAEGLLDSEYFTQTSEQLNAKSAAGSLGMSSAQPHMTIAQEEGWRQYSIIPAVTSGSNSTKMVPKNSNYEPPRLVVTDHCKYPEAAVRLVDFFFTREGSRMVRGGPEYGTWEGDGGWEIVTGEDGGQKIKLHMGAYDSFWNFRATVTPLSLPYFCGEDVMFITVAGDAKNTYFSDMVEKSGNIGCARFGYPEVSYTEEEITALSEFVDIDSYVTQMDAKFITGSVGMDEWENYISTLESMDVERMIQIKQQAYDRWNSID